MSGGDAQKATDSPRGVEQFAWSPGGKQLAYVAADEPPNKKAIEQHDEAWARKATRSPEGDHRGELTPLRSCVRRRWVPLAMSINTSELS